MSPTAFFSPFAARCELLSAPPMLRSIRRYGSLAYWSLSEAVLFALGRRPPYGIVKIEIAGDLSEEPPETRLLGIMQGGSRGDYFSLVALLRWVREDPRVRGVLVRCGDLRIGWAKVQELRRSLAALRAAGKTVWCYLPHAGVQALVLASTADRLVLTPAGTLDIAGLSSEVTFLAGALKKLGIEAELVQMGKYKSAAETFTRSEMSDAHREMVESLVDDLYEQIIDAIAAGRHLERERVRALVDRGPFVAQEALEAGLIDALLYEDEAEEQLRAHCGDARTIEQHDYLARRGRAVRRMVMRQGRAAIGVLHLTGTMKTGESISGAEPASACGAKSVTRDLKELRERSDIRAVVVRVSSPGGSGLASDLMWHEVMRTRKRKPVVVSFGDVAASGGYYVGVAGSPVVAEAGTITGSIGVLAGKALLRGLYDHLGITKQVVSRGRHAGLYSDYVPLGDEERQRLQAEAEFFYADFLGKVASGRQLTPEAVASAAQGRVWTGRQAQSLGLIDQLGGIERALDEAKILAGLAPQDLVAVERYPKPRRRWKLSLNLNPPQARFTSLLPWARVLREERIWAILPFRFRFF
jgi:protease IV